MKQICTVWQKLTCNFTENCTKIKRTTFSIGTLPPSRGTQTCKFTTVVISCFLRIIFPTWSCIAFRSRRHNMTLVSAMHWITFIPALQTDLFCRTLTMLGIPNQFCNIFTAQKKSVNNFLFEQLVLPRKFAAQLYNFKMSREIYMKTLGQVCSEENFCQVSFTKELKSFSWKKKREALIKSFHNIMRIQLGCKKYGHMKLSALMKHQKVFSNRT